MQSETCATRDFRPPIAAGSTAQRRVRPGTVCAALLLASACAMAQTAGAASVNPAPGLAAAATTTASVGASPSASVDSASSNAPVRLAAADHAGGLLLSDSQMDRVAAGYQQSSSTASASALFGFAATGSSTYASTTGPIRMTGSTSAGVAGGIGAGASADAKTRFR